MAGATEMAGAGFLGTLAALLLALPASAADYTVLITGRAAGTMSVTGAAERTITYSFNDRGRGPDLTSSFAVDAGGVLTRLETKGVDYLKAPVAETFTTTAGQGRWSSQADEGTKAAGAYYLTYQATPEDLAALARALLKAPDNALDILPAGRASIRKVAEREVGAGRTKVVLYAIDGLSLTPLPLWLDASGELYFSGGSWSGTVRKGAEALAPELVTAQDEALRAAEVAAARTLGRKPSGLLVIRNANVFDAKTRTMRPGSTVVINANRIEHVWFGAEAATPADAEVIDAGGKALLPGMWDMHVHISDNNEGMLHLAAGVTSVRDMANDIDELAARRARYDSGELIGPRIYRAGIIDGPGPLAAPTKILAATPEEMRGFINRYADLGYEQIKLYSSLKPELVPVAVEAAHARGLRVSGHIPAGMTAAQAVAAGYDELQHVNFVLLNFFPDVADKTNSMVRFTTIGDRAAGLDLNSAPVNAFLDELKVRDIVIDPTLATFEGMFTAAPRQADPSLAAIAGRLPPTVARGLYGGGMAKTDADRERYRGGYAQMIAMVGRLHAKGVRMVPGTDGFAGFLYHRELELWARAGVPNLDILYAATLGSASVGHHERDLGSIEQGKLADLVLIDGDPSKTISDVRKPVLVIKDGRVFEPAKLYAQVGVRP